MNKEKIRALVAQNRLKEAIKELEATNPNDALQLSARLSNLNSQVRLGVLSFNDETLESNRIAKSIIYFLGNNDSEKDSIKVNSNMNLEKKLLTIAAENKRRRPEVSNSAKEIIKELEDYEMSNSTEPTFDITGRRLRAIYTKAEKLFQELSQIQEEDLEQKVALIMQYLESPIPTYDNLQKAYELAVGLGFSSKMAEQKLELRPDIDDAKISIAENIEVFVTTLQKR